MSAGVNAVENGEEKTSESSFKQSPSLESICKDPNGGCLVHLFAKSLDKRGKRVLSDAEILSQRKWLDSKFANKDVGTEIPYEELTNEGIISSINCENPVSREALNSLSNCGENYYCPLKKILERYSTKDFQSCISTFIEAAMKTPKASKEVIEAYHSKLIKFIDSVFDKGNLPHMNAHQSLWMVANSIYHMHSLDPEKISDILTSDYDNPDPAISPFATLHDKFDFEYAREYCQNNNLAYAKGRLERGNEISQKVFGKSIEELSSAQAS